MRQKRSQRRYLLTPTRLIHSSTRRIYRSACRASEPGGIRWPFSRLHRQTYEMQAVIQRNCNTMTRKEELEQAWQELQAVPAYVERFNPDAEVHLVVVQHCGQCGHWHNMDGEPCPTMVE